MSDEINPAQQRGVSVDVLAERLTNHSDSMRSEFQALHHHFTALEVKVDAHGEKVAGVEAALHEHVAQQHHTGTRDRLIEMGTQHLQFERKFGEIEMKFAEIELARVVEKASIDARDKQRAQGLTFLDKAWVMVFGAIPTVLLIYSTFYK